MKLESTDPQQTNAADLINAAPKPSKKSSGAAKNASGSNPKPPPSASQGPSPFDLKAQAQIRSDADNQHFFEPRQFSKISFNDTAEKVVYKDDQLMTSVDGEKFFDAVPAEDRKTVPTATKDGVPGKYSMVGRIPENMQTERKNTSEVLKEAAQLVGPLMQLGAAALTSPFRMFQGGYDAALDPALGLGDRATQAREDGQNDLPRRGASET